MRVDRFELEQELGRGGMGVVYRARDGATGARVALKLLPPLADTEERRRALIEARAGARLDHPGIARLLDAGQDAQGRQWLALELVAGETLQARLQREGPLPPAEALRVARDLAGALEHAHGRGVLHRDLKPGNVMLGPEGRVVLLDLGLARLLDRETRVTATGEALGTPAYMAPEQVRGERERIGPATDVYGLSATLFALLTGQPPYGEGSQLETLRAVLERPPPSPRALRPEVSPGLDAVVRRGLAKPPEERFPTIGELRVALERAALPAAPGARGSRAVPLGAVALLVFLVLAGGLARRGRAPTPAASPLATPGSAAGPAERPADVRARVKELLLAGRRRAAAQEAERGLLAGEDPELRWLLTRALVGLGELGVREHLKRALAAAPPSAEWAPEAAALRERMTAIEPHALEASARQRAGDPAGALAAAERAVALAPEEPYALLLRSWHRVRAGQPREALEDADAVLRRDPRHTLALEMRARLQAELPGGSLHEALRCLDLALEGDPDHRRLLHLRGGLRLDARDAAGAWADVERLLRLLEGGQEGGLLAEALGLRARVRIERGELEAARADLDRALGAAPDDLSLLHLRAGVRERLRDLAGAEADHRQLLTLAPPDLPWAQESRRWLQATPAGRLAAEAAEAWERGDVAGTGRALDRMLELDPHDPGLLLRRATVRRALADPAGALEDARRARELAPDLPKASWEEAAALLSLGGRVAEARAAVNAGLALEPRDPEGLVLAARVSQAEDDPRGALDQLERVATLDPGMRAAVQLLRAQALLALRDPSGARRACDQGIELGPATLVRAELHGFRALALALLGEREAALADRARVHELVPGSETAAKVDERLREAGLR